VLVDAAARLDQLADEADHHNSTRRKQESAISRSSNG
jgi:hypothetical protein